jgi:MFS superfamily sulfate permease-like transporter
MNFVNPLFGGVPTCHGSGGMAGHYAFGGRTGGSVVIYGIFYLILGMFFSGSFQQVLVFFPKPMLGAILIVEAVALIALIRDVMGDEVNRFVAPLVALMAVNLPYGYVVALIAGTGLIYFLKRKSPGFMSIEPASRD